MAFEKVRAFQYVADSIEDLAEIKESKMGTECYVIKEACEYKLKSDGNWVKQVPASSGADVDLTGYATEFYVDNAISNLASEDYVKNEIANINIPEVDLTNYATQSFVNEAVEGFVLEEKFNELLEHPVFKSFGSEDMPAEGHLFGIFLEAKENKSLVEKMMETGMGMYNFWVGKGAPGQPEEVVAKNSSCRGLCCYDTNNVSGNKYGWILMVDQDGDFYTQYIRSGKPQGWKSLVSAEAVGEAVAAINKAHDEKLKACYRPIKYEVSNLPIGTQIDYRDKEIRIYCPDSVVFTKHEAVGEGGDSNAYYMTFTCYAPEGAVALKEGDRGIFVDELIPLEGGSGTGIDKFGRRYKNHWFALAAYDGATDTWNYYGKNSITEKYIGWSYVVAWYDENNNIINTDAIRINLSNKDCHLIVNGAVVPMPN